MATQHESYPMQQRSIERLRRLGVRVTPQRLLVIEALVEHGGHVTAEAIMQHVAQRYPSINLATIYRTLDVLLNAGLVAEADLGVGANYFELVGESPHHHLVCERCGTVAEMEHDLLAPLRVELLQRYGFRVNPRHLALFGVCSGCLHSAPRDASPTEE